MPTSKPSSSSRWVEVWPWLPFSSSHWIFLGVLAEWIGRHSLTWFPSHHASWCRAGRSIWREKRQDEPRKDSSESRVKLRPRWKITVSLLGGLPIEVRYWSMPNWTLNLQNVIRFCSVVIKISYRDNNSVTKNLFLMHPVTLVPPSVLVVNREISFFFLLGWLLEMFENSCLISLIRE